MTGSDFSANSQTGHYKPVIRSVRADAFVRPAKRSEARQPLELEARSKLHLSEVVGRGCDLAQGSIPRSNVRESKALVIEGIEHLRPHLQ